MKDLHAYNDLQLNKLEKKEEIPEFRAGDTVAVHVRVHEGTRSRVQIFEGYVVGRRNRGIHSSFKVRKTASGVAVEKTFPLHSPLVEAINVKRRGKVRQAKLYYLRALSGRAARIKERR